MSSPVIEAPPIVQSAPREQYVDARRVANEYNVTPRHILRLAQLGRIPYLPVGGAVRFRPSEVASALEKLKRKP
jgi:hypothetical protein